MRAATCLLLLTAVGCITPGAVRRAGANCAWRVCLGYQDSDRGREYRIVNQEPVPVTVSLAFRTLQNLHPPAQQPIERVIPPRSSRTLARLTTVRAGRSVDAEVAISIDLGSSDTEPDADALYAVPFGGSQPRELVQGYAGEGSHLGSMRYSLDFAMPEGTPVLAAREGVVLYVQDGFLEGGADPALLEQANLVVVAHRDGTMASYGHLAAGLLVAVGDRVTEGDVLGLSGQTGFTAQPHLHFHVGLRLLGEPGRTIAVQLRDKLGRRLPLEVGSLIEPSTAIAR